MDTNLKKGKKIRGAIYKLITIASLFTMVATALIGREALLNLYKEGYGTFTGKIYYLTEFREYISEIYTFGMLGYAGAGDDNGYPLTSDSGKSVTEAAQALFQQEVQKGGKDLLYLVKQEENTFAHANFSYPLFSEYDGHLLLPEDTLLCCYWDGSQTSLQFFTADKYSTGKVPEDYYTHQYKPNSKIVGQLQLLIAIPESDTYDSEYFRELSCLAQNYQTILLTLVISGGLFLFFGLLSLLSYKAVRLVSPTLAAFSGKLWLEGKLLILIAMIWICYSFNLWYFNGAILPRFYAVSYLWLYAPMAILLYLFCNDWIRNKGSVVKHSLLFALLRECKKYIKGLPWTRKAMQLYIVYGISGLFSILSGAAIWYLNISGIFYYSRFSSAEILYVFAGLLIIGGILMLLFAKRLKHFVSDTTALAGKLTDISNGVSGEQVVLAKNSLLKKAAEDLNDVEQGIEAAIEQNIRSNKMRVELITNVSHDLKTPLTSIINYADLLCEEALPKPACEYATALRSKAYRLKGMVQDVFELSKATSGNLPIECSRLDLAKLIRQTLADMDEKIQESTLTFKLNIVTEPLMIEADGEKLYRIFQNLIINALQYSLEHSRVYIQLDKKDTQAVAWIKNTSKQELDFDPEEIVERFVRADASRTTEGSGLGLSIAQSFTEACGGTFSIELNADLFMACVSFPISEVPLEEVNTNYEKASDNESN